MSNKLFNNKVALLESKEGEMEKLVEKLCLKVKNFAKLYGVINLEAIDEYINNYVEGVSGGNLTETKKVVKKPAIGNNQQIKSPKEWIKQGAKQLLDEHLETETENVQPSIGDVSQVPPEFLAEIDNMKVEV